MTTRKYRNFIKYIAIIKSVSASHKGKILVGTGKWIIDILFRKNIIIQILNLVTQLPIRTRLKLGKELTKEVTKAELQHYLDVFRADEITEEDILSEVKAVRKEHYEKCQQLRSSY